MTLTGECVKPFEQLQFDRSVTDFLGVIIAKSSRVNPIVCGDHHHVSSPASDMGGRGILMRETVIENSSRRNRERFRATEIEDFGLRFKSYRIWKSRPTIRKSFSVCKLGCGLVVAHR